MQAVNGSTCSGTLEIENGQDSSWKMRDKKTERQKDRQG